MILRIFCLMPEATTYTVRPASWVYRCMVGWNAYVYCFDMVRGTTSAPARDIRLFMERQQIATARWSEV